MDINKITLIGRIGATPTIHNGSTGDFATFSLATSEPWKNKDGTYSSKTQWHRIVVYNEKLVKNIANKCQKGTLMYIEGKMQYRDTKTQYTNQPSTISEVIVDRFHGMAFPLMKETVSSEPAKQNSFENLPDLIDDETPF